MANSKKVKKIKKVYVCPTCKGEQCFDCDSQGELYDYEDNGSFDDVGSAQSVH